MALPPIEVTVEVGGRELVAGTLRVYERRGQTATFQYEERYLAHPAAYALDPALPLGSGVFQPPAGKVLFSCFSDAAPDRWGQNLMRRAERDRAHATKTAPRALGPVDFLVGVQDRLRQGALRLRDGSGGYLSDAAVGVPKMVSLAHLLDASDRLARDGDDEDVRDLILAGSSLGGARPKAAVITEQGKLALAKFPRPPDDDWDVAGWEKVEHELARRAGITAADAALVRVAGRNVLVVDRFDRVEDRRIGFASALTMLEASDMELHSYLEIADAIERNANTSDRDLEELFRRLVFSILSSNTDDHLRNHGFLRRGPGWDLSPAYDMNPNPFSAGTLSLAVDLEDPTASIETALSVATAFRVSAARARVLTAEVEAATRSWREVATGMGIPARETAIMGEAFEGPERTIARRRSAPATGVDVDLEDPVAGAAGGPPTALPTDHTASPDRRTQNGVCGAWMPRARARCVLPPHPTGHHRSER